MVSAAQRKARANFARMARNGTLAKLRKKAAKNKPRHRNTMRSRGGTDLRRSNIDDSLLLKFGTSRDANEKILRPLINEMQDNIDMIHKFLNRRK